MTVTNPLSLINMLTCLLIVVRIMTWRNMGSRFKPWISFVAWLLMTSCMLLIVSLYLGYYRIAESAEVVINILLCVAVYVSSGNLSHLFKRKK